MNAKNCKVVVLIIVVFVIGISIFMIYKGFSKDEKVLLEQPYLEVHYISDTLQKEFTMNLMDKKIQVMEKSICKKENCQVKEDTYILDYSKENMKKVLHFLETNFNIKDHRIEVLEANLTDFQENIMKTIVFGQYFFELEIEDYQYKLVYTGSEYSYDIYFKEDGSIMGKKTKVNDEYDIISLDNYDILFDASSMQELNDFIKKTGNEDEILYRNGALFKDEEPYIKSLIYNDVSYLKNAKKIKLLYTIGYDGIDCLTPVLRLYDDGTYAYYDTFALGDQLLIPKEGRYFLDIDKLLDSIHLYPEEKMGFYVINDVATDNSYVTGVSNEFVNDFLKELGVELQMCLQQQE